MTTRMLIELNDGERRWINEGEVFPAQGFQIVAQQIEGETPATVQDAIAQTTAASEPINTREPDPVAPERVDEARRIGGGRQYMADRLREVIAMASEHFELAQDPGVKRFWALIRTDTQTALLRVIAGDLV